MNSSILFPRMRIFFVMFLMAFCVPEVNAGIRHYTDEKGVRNFTYVPHASPINQGDKRLSKKANNAISALKNYNDCLSKKGKRSQLYKTVLIETGKWLESHEARWSEPAAREIKAALTDYENYESLSFRKNNGFGEGEKGRIENEGVLWLQFIEEYPAANYQIDPNLEAMMIYVLGSAIMHTNRAMTFMLDISSVLQNR